MKQNLRHKELAFEFVENVPENLNEGVLYISTKYASAIHKCCCGCGNEVVTSLSPVGWSLIFDGDTVSLEPSIGNWNFACRSHYWISRNKVRPAAAWPESRIEAGRAREQTALKRYFKQKTDEESAN
ncbi:MAG TPA: DUF6527 family protein [Candidatus Angelobacter sp.]|nr:DUF6527 family protein [Candidatus Angelobacter sp.]